MLAFPKPSLGFTISTPFQNGDFASGCEETAGEVGGRLLPLLIIEVQPMQYKITFLQLLS